MESWFLHFDKDLRLEIHHIQLFEKISENPALESHR